MRLSVSGAPCLVVFLLVGVLTGCAKPAPDPVVAPPSAQVKPGTTLTASPDPVVIKDEPLGETSISWTTNAAHTEMHIGGPAGQLFGHGGSSGTFKTGKWVTDGMTFFLQDSDAAVPTDASATLGSLAVAVRDDVQ